MKWRSLSLIFFVLKSTLFDFNIAILAFLYFHCLYFFHLLTFNLHVPLYLKCIRTHTSVCIFVESSLHVWLLMRVFTPFTFNVIVAILGFISVIWCLFSFCSLYYLFTCFSSSVFVGLNIFSMPFYFSIVSWAILLCVIILVLATWQYFSNINVHWSNLKDYIKHRFLGPTAEFLS